MQDLKEEIAHKLLENVFSDDFKGYDPYDIKAHPFFRTLIHWGNKSRPAEIFREIILELVYQHPNLTRTLFNIKPAHNAKALGLIGTSCVELSLINKPHSNLIQNAQLRIDELLSQYQVNTQEGIGWGYPFDWQSSKLIPANTPNGIVSTAVGEYFWTRYLVTGNTVFLQKCIQIARFLNQLPADEVTDGALCFSYVPHYQNYIHNLNLFVADFLIKTGQKSGNISWVERGNMAINYTLNDQHENGAFDYNGPPEAPKNGIDNYHTGFVLRMLKSCLHYTGREDVKEALEKGLKFYLNHFFTEEGIPKMKPDSVYRIDIHSAAEAVNCLVFLADTCEEALPVAESVLQWTLHNLYDLENKDFFYAVSKSRFTGRTYRSEIKYMRWSQAWMLRALSRYILYSEQKRIIF